MLNERKKLQIQLNEWILFLCNFSAKNILIFVFTYFMLEKQKYKYTDTEVSLTIF